MDSNKLQQNVRAESATVGITECIQREPKDTEGRQVVNMTMEVDLPAMSCKLRKQQTEQANTVLTQKMIQTFGVTDEVKRQYSEKTQTQFQSGFSLLPVTDLIEYGTSGGSGSH